MKSVKEIKLTIKQLKVESSNEIHSRVLNRLQNKLNSKQQHSAEEPNVWRIIMNSKITKSAVVAVIIIAVLIGIKLLDGTPAYGMSDVVEQLRNARIIHIYSSIYPRKNEDNNFDCDKEYVLEKWIDIERGRTRTSSLSLSRIAGKKNGTSKIMFSKVEDVFDGEHMMQINHRLKSVEFFTLSNFQKVLYTRKTVERFLDETHLGSNELPEYVKIGQEQIDTELLDVWEREKFTGDRNYAFKTVCWVKPSTYEIRYLKEWRKEKNNDNGEWELTAKVKIGRNVTPPPTTFLTETPEGYRHENTKEAAYEYLLYSSWWPSLETIETKIVTAFTLADGSVIMGWYTEDKNNANPDDNIFENLELGGGIPKLPAEIYSLESFKDKGVTIPSGLTYYGRHLAYTKKDGRFYEWSIYVPDRNIVQQEGLQSYRVLARLNPETRQDLILKCLNDTYIDSINIQPDEFNTFVLGAMKECSDNVEATENITYDMVLELEKQVRASIEK